ncbi:hypothetical protein ITJ57_15755 [Plantibacter sp. VKM Ac-2880]|uniref:hypothetical protein n=1 Tax=Plantibacter sp. VKM Ac-2880 TaxID=2783827 RepID=UPI0018908B80|nr:hypothetical protein [Plantibacter sp. VKM Ac-2880]MBF4570223.1 hypothetical protein [Plantibacter sp. VKM Ac-2880]
MTANHGGERTGEQAGALASVRGPGGGPTASSLPALEVLDGDETVLAVAAGVVHAVVGARSATRRFVDALAGAAGGRRRRRTAEVVRIEGKVVTLASRAASSAAGIAVVTGGQAISWTQDVGDNVLLGNEHGSRGDGFSAAVRAALRLGRSGGEARGTDRDRVVRALATVGLTTEPTTAVAELTTLERRLVELARAVAAGAAVVIVDEPGAGLCAPEREHWQAALRAVAATPRLTGTAPVVLLVTGTVTGLAAVASAVTLLGTGSGANGPRTLPVSDAADERRVLDALAAGLGSAAALRGTDRASDSGRSCPDRDARPAERASGLVVERWHASHPADATRTVVDGLSFACAPGEVLGLFGPLDSGAGEVLLSLFGRSYGAMVSGTVAIDGQTVDLSTMDRARDAGLLYTTEHPIRYDLAFLGGVPSSVSPTSLTRMVSTGLADGRRAYPATTGASGLAAVLPGAHRGPTAEQFTESLRSLLDTPARVVLLAEPFGDRRGADAAERVDLIRAIAASGRAVVVAGDDPSALVEVSDRVIAVRHGRAVGETRPDRDARGHRDAVLAVLDAMGGLA